MNKLLKGAIAGTAGIALLLGGASTFALWNDSASVNVGSVSSGTLTLVSGAAGTWRNISADAVSGGVAIPSIATYRIVPGDKLELTQTVTVNATGNNLVATLAYSDASIAAVGTANAALKSALVFAATATGTGVTPGPAANTFRVAAAATATTVTIKLTVDLPSTVSGLTAQTGVVDLSALSFTLTQIRP